MRLTPSTCLLQSEWIKHGHSPEQCELDLSVQMPAGSEPCVTAIRGILLHLLTSPTAYHRLKEEIDDGIKAGRISKPVTNEEAQAMPYLQAVISEGLRMTPTYVAEDPSPSLHAHSFLCYGVSNFISCVQRIFTVSSSAETSHRSEKSAALPKQFPWVVTPVSKFYTLPTPSNDSIN